MIGSTKAWIVANIELLYVIAQSIFAIILFGCVLQISNGEEANVLILGLLFSVLVFIPIFSIRSLPMFLLFSAAILSCFCCLSIRNGIELPSSIKFWPFICILISLFIGFLSATVAHNNFDGVTSLRAFYQDRNIFVFKSNTLCSVNRFIAGFVLTLTLMTEVFAFISIDEKSFSCKINRNVEKRVGDNTRRHIDTDGSTALSNGIEGKYSIASTRILIEQDVNKLSKIELRLMRNEIFARYGYIFKSKDLQEYFLSQPWYHPQKEDVSSMLSDIEKENIAFIQKHEKQN